MESEVLEAIKAIDENDQLVEMIEEAVESARASVAASQAVSVAASRAVSVAPSRSVSVAK